MSHLQYFDYPGFGAHVRSAIHYSQAVRLPDNTVHISGQGGWDAGDSSASPPIPTDVNEEMEAAFRNVQLTLEKAGSKGWEQVYKVTAWIVGLGGKDSGELQTALTAGLKKWCPNHQPLLTVPGADSLALPAMRVEIEVAAHLGN